VSDTTVAPTPRYWSARALAVAIPALELFIFCLLLAILLIVGAGVVARSVLNASLSWSGELASWALVWLTFTGMALGQAQNRHIALGFLAAKLPRRGQAALQLLIDLIVAYTTFMLLFASIQLLQEIGGISSGLQWDNRIEYLMVPIGSVLALVLTGLVRLRDGARLGSVIAPIVLGAVLSQFTVLNGPPFPDASPSLILSLAFVSSMLIGVPIGFAMLFGAFLSTWGADLLPAAGVVHTMVGGASPFVLLAIPFFLTAGYLMNSGGLATRLIDFASALVGHLRGGLAQANVFHSVLLGGICGSSGADAASTTKILVPEMMRRGYSGPFACAVTAVGSILPSCFPPSIALLVYASIAQVSVAQLFTAGIVPGLLMCALMMLMTHIVAKRRGYERAPRRATVGEMARAGIRAAPASVLAFVILGLLRFGVMTATEVGIVAVLWSFVIGKFLYRAFTWRELYRDMVECAADSALIFFLIAVAAPYAWVLLAEQMPQLVLAWVTGLIQNKWELLLAVNAMTLVAGCFLEVIPSMLILVPIVTPLMIAVGVDPIHLGIIVVFNLLLAEVSPPIGILVFISAQIARVPAGAVFRECLPFVAVCGLGLLVITFVPFLSLGLWHTMAR
jgi:tripartite ATP-independent transporter DctM subunit